MASKIGRSDGTEGPDERRERRGWRREQRGDIGWERPILCGLRIGKPAVAADQGLRLVLAASGGPLERLGCGEASRG